MRARMSLVLLLFPNTVSHKTRGMSTGTYLLLSGSVPLTGFQGKKNSFPPPTSTPHTQFLPKIGLAH